MPSRKTTASSIPASKVERYQKLIGSIPDLELKGASMPYTSVNGNMSSFLDKEGNLALRLDENGREKFIRDFDTTLAVQHGVVLKEYVSVPESAFSKPVVIKKYFQQSYAYVKALKPKAKKK